jgi:hypothetical protein
MLAARLALTGDVLRKIVEPAGHFDCPPALVASEIVLRHLLLLHVTLPLLQVHFALEAGEPILPTAAEKLGAAGFVFIVLYAPGESVNAPPELHSDEQSKEQDA